MTAVDLCPHRICSVDHSSGASFVLFARIAARNGKGAPNGEAKGRLFRLDPFGKAKKTAKGGGGKAPHFEVRP